MKTFYHGLKAVHRPLRAGSTPVRAIDGTLLSDKAEILRRWVDHFQLVLNQPAAFDDSVLGDTAQWPTASDLDDIPSREEIACAIKQMASGKAPGSDGIPSEVLKEGGLSLLAALNALFCKIWSEEVVPQDFKDTLIVHIYKRKGDRACCDNHRGISLLSIAGKVLARILLNRLQQHIHDSDIIPESQCGFRVGRGTMDMVFTVRQIQEKCREQHLDLY